MENIIDDLEIECQELLYIKCQSCGTIVPDFEIDWFYLVRLDIQLCDECAAALRKLEKICKESKI